MHAKLSRQDRENDQHGERDAHDADRRRERKQRCGGEDHRGERGERLRPAHRRRGHGIALLVFVEVQVTAVLGVVEDFARFEQHVARQCGTGFNRALFREEVELVPVLPRLERFAVDLGRKPNAEALFDVQPRDLDARTAREVCPVFPERSVRRVVVLPDEYLVDRPVSREWTSGDCGPLPRVLGVYPSQ